MRLRMTDDRKRRIEALQEATGENTKSGALDVAARYYVRMAGGPGVPEGQVQELLARAETQGSLTVEEIADVLDCPELAVDASVEWSVGEEQSSSV